MAERRKIMRLGRVRSLDGKIDSRYQRDEIEKRLECEEQIKNLGEKFLSDKKSLEERINKVLDSRMDETAKKIALDVLEEKLRRIEEQYDKDVKEEYERFESDMDGWLEEVGKISDDILEEADAISDWKAEAMDEDAEDVKEVLQNESKELEEMKEKYIKELELRIQQANKQIRDMRVKKFTRKR